MTTLYKKYPLAILASLIGLAIIAVIDLLFYPENFLDSLPQFSPFYLIRSVAIAIACILFLLGFINHQKPQINLVEYPNVLLSKFSLAGVLFVGLSFLAAFLFKPGGFNILSDEDNVIEWGSAIFHFGAAIVFIIILAKLIFHKAPVNFPKFTKLSLGLLVIGFFVMGMEEVSWFQRVADIPTPDVFAGNIQNEMNLHNFASDTIEIIYYSAAFVFFVLLPYLNLLVPAIQNNDYLNLFLPRPYIAVMGTLFCAYNFDMWNMMAMQVCFWSSLIILFLLAKFSINNGEKYVIYFAIVLVCLSQLLFLIKGEETFARLWEITEYKEFLIPLVALIYSLDKLKLFQVRSLSMLRTD
ncbi:MAG: hypothetical protein HC796_08185 [Synechococcaceae cyanobacterium RL_1_2]|nr:hypothetical protein [Synechococcaceae cyanobacterium RL_1_2]